MSKVIDLDGLKCVVYIDYDIPFDFKEERASVYETIINNLVVDLDERKTGYKICPDYTTLSTITIFKAAKISNNEWRKHVLESIENLIKVRVEDEEFEGALKEYTLDYTVEFSFVESYSIYY